MYKGVTTSELDELAAETAASMTATHPDYAVVSVAYAAPYPVASICHGSLSDFSVLASPLQQSMPSVGRLGCAVTGHIRQLQAKGTGAAGLALLKLDVLIWLYSAGPLCLDVNIHVAGLLLCSWQLALQCQTFTRIL